jgi:DNA polymerase-3 subunit delta
MRPQEVVARARRGELAPVWLLVGEERFLRDRAVAALREASLGGGLAEFNEDKFTAGEADVERVLSAARTVPMMAPRRFVLVRSVERWDRGDEDADVRAETPLDVLADYAKKPIDSTCLVLVADKLDKRRRLAALARKEGFLVECDALPDEQLGSFVSEQCRERGHAIDDAVAELVAQLAGPSLAVLVDAAERLCLHAGPGNPITEDAVSQCVARVRTGSTWDLVDAVGRRDLGASLRLLADVYDPRDRGLPLLGALAWSVRQVARTQAAMQSGARGEDAARRAGVPPFKAREVAARAQKLRPRDVERMLLLLAETDLALKGSRRAPDRVLEDMVVRMCAR